MKCRDIHPPPCPGPCLQHYSHAHTFPWFPMLKYIHQVACQDWPWKISPLLCFYAPLVPPNPWLFASRSLGEPLAFVTFLFPLHLLKLLSSQLSLFFSFMQTLSSRKPSSIAYFVFSQSSFAHNDCHSSIFTFCFCSSGSSFRSKAIAPTVPGVEPCLYRN